jgi:hypothetical protein
VKAPKRDDVIGLVDDVLRTLAEPLGKDDRRHGWTPRNRGYAVRALDELRTRLADARPLKESEVRPSLARDFDDAGVEGGCLMNRIAQISVLANALVQRGG